MDTGQAISKLKPIKGVLRAFEHIDEVLEAAHAAEGTISSLKGQIEKGSRELDVIRDKVTKADRELGEFQKAATAKRNKMTGDYALKEQELQDGLDNRRIAFEKEEKARVREAEVDKEKAKAELNSLNEQVSKARATLNELEAAIEGLQRRVMRA